MGSIKAYVFHEIPSLFDQAEYLIFQKETLWDTPWLSLMANIILKS